MVLLPTVRAVGLTAVGLLLRTPKRTSDPALQLLTVLLTLGLTLFAGLRVVR